MTSPLTHSPHCDHYIDDPAQPECLRKFLHFKRLPAVCQLPGCSPETEPLAFKYIPEEYRPHVWTDPVPVCFADHNGKRVRLVMASRFGDVGITSNLDACLGYDARVTLDQLSNFGDKP